MKINPNTISAALLGGLATILLLRYRDPVAGFLAKLNHIGPGNSTEDLTLGLIVVGFAAAVLVAIVRILTSNNKNQ